MPLENAPLRTPLHPDLKLSDRVVKFLVSETSVWGTWLTILRRFVQPIVVVSTLDFANTAAQTSSDLTVNVAGAIVGNHVDVVPPVALAVANSFFQGLILSAGVVSVRFHNYSAGAINPGSGSFTIIVRNH